MNLTCVPCGHRFTVPFKLTMPIKAWAKKMNAVKCPNCGVGTDKLRVGHAADSAKT